MKTPDCIQGSAEWLRWRSQGIGASAAAVIAGVSHYQSLWRLWMELRYAITNGAEGRPPEEENFFMRWGKEHEDKVRQCFERKHDDLLLPACGENEERPFMRASFDGITTAGEPTELKAPSAATVREVLLNGTSSTGYLLYWWQVQHQMFVCGSQTGYLLFWLAIERREDGTLVAKGLPKDRVLAADDIINIEVRKALSQQVSTWRPVIPHDTSLGATAYLEPAGENLFEFWIEFEVAADPQAQARLVADCERFWQSVVDGVEPAKDPTRDPFEPMTPEQQAEWGQIAMERRVLTRQIDNLLEAKEVISRDRKAIDAQMISMMGNAACGEYAGLKLTRYLVSGSVDYEALMQDGVVTDDDINSARGKGYLAVRVTDRERERDERSDDDDLTAPPVALVKETYIPRSEQEQNHWTKLAQSRRHLDRKLSFIDQEITTLKDRRGTADLKLVAMMGEFATGFYANLCVSRYWVEGRVSSTKLVQNMRLDPAALDKYRGPNRVGLTVTDATKKKASRKPAIAA